MNASDSVTRAAYSQVMEQAGFYREGRPAAGVVDAESLRREGDIEKLIRYGTVIDEDRINAVSIYELSGSPCIYFTRLTESHPDPLKIQRLQKLAWNHGSAPLLWVITPAKVMLLNCYLKPLHDDRENLNKYLLGLFELTEAGLSQLRDLAGRREFETGNFWLSTEGRTVSRRERVDAALLADLESAEELLTSSHQLRPPIAHSLLGRSIFTAYLEDRGIVTQDFLRRRFGVERFSDALLSKQTTYDLFRWIRETFNGDLFPLTLTANQLVTKEEDLVTSVHLDIVREFLKGTNLSTGQQRLWPYEFDVIPIELISSIYENFVHSADPNAARERSTHYTPVNLVDLTLSQVFENLPADSKLADLSCGSGLFLVEGLRRLVARRVVSGEELSRGLVRDVLQEQIFGVDVSEEAVRIAAFSIYLALLELDPNPEPPEELSFQPLIGRNLFVANAFDETADFNFREPFVNRNLGAIVGNPPWRRSRANELAIRYCEQRQYPLALDTPDQAFLWRIGDFSNSGTKIGLVLHAKPFFSKTPQAIAAKSRLLTRYKPNIIINLSNLRKDGLFPKSTAPAMVLIATGCESEIGDTFDFVRIDRSESFKRHGIIEVGPEGVRRASVWRAAFDADWLKVAAFGGPRDMAFIERLREDGRFVNLGALTEKLGWISGRGVEPGVGVVLNDLEPKLPTTYLKSGRMPPFGFSVDDLVDSTPPTEARRGYSNPELFKGPLLICTRGIPASGFHSAIVDDDLLYSEQYIGFSAKAGNAEERHYLNGILNSSLANYLLFMTSSVWGIERDKVEKIDLLQLPVPDPVKADPVHVLKLLDLEAALIASRDEPYKPTLHAELNQTVFDLYGASPLERTIVEDLVRLGIPLHSKPTGSQGLLRPTLPQLQDYATSVISVIQPFLRALNETAIRAEIVDAGNTPLQVVRFTWTSPGIVNHPIVNVVFAKELSFVLDSIAEQLSTQLAEHVYGRRILRIYVEDGFYIVKPAQLRYWSCSAGLSDADTLISEQMSNQDGLSSQAA